MVVQVLRVACNKGEGTSTPQLPAKVSAGSACA